MKQILMKMSFIKAGVSLQLLSEEYHYEKTQTLHASK